MKSLSFLAGLFLLSACATTPMANAGSVLETGNMQGQGQGRNTTSQQGQRAGGAQQGRFAEVSESGATTLNTNQIATAVSTLPVSTLSEAERNGLIFMREEEKLAYDVYVALGKKWTTDKRFQNIPNSEASHTESVRVLLEKYDLDDPNATHTAGVYANEDLQKAYDAFLAKGEQSLLEALKVGDEIEELDIADLQRLLLDVESEDIRLVYEELLRGSRNHLRAFMKGITQQGGTYTAVHISQADFDAIANGSMEKGSGN